MRRRIAYWPLSGLILFVSSLPTTASPPADDPPPFGGAKTSWHEGFDRFDYLMDEETLDLRPFKRDPGERFGIQDPPQGTRRCVVVAPKTPAPGKPWSWQGCYWDHQPQAEVELLRRGFHVAYISANAALKPDKTWDAWYAFLTEKHGLSPRPAFIGMSRGGEYAYTWATAHPGKVSCIYADNPAIHKDALGRLGDLVAADVPILHVCGSIDPLLGRVSEPIEAIYRGLGGRISVIIKDGAGHHPHSLRNPAPIAHFIAESVRSIERTTPSFLGGRVSRTTVYGSAGDYRSSPDEGTYLTLRGPHFRPSFDRYAFDLPGVEGSINVIVPTSPALGMPWAFRADFVDGENTVDLALLDRGFHIVTGPVPYNGDGPTVKAWNAVHDHLVSHGFAKRPILEGAGDAAGEAYAWAIANPEEVSCIYGENPSLRCTMTKAQPIDGLSALAGAGVPILHACGGLDPQIETQTRETERRYKALGGVMTVFVDQARGHSPTSPLDPGPVVDFLMSKQAVPSSIGVPKGDRK